MEDQKIPTDQAAGDTAAVQGEGQDLAPDLVIAGGAIHEAGADPETGVAATQDPAAGAPATKRTGPGVAQDPMTGTEEAQTENPVEWHDPIAERIGTSME